MTLMKGINPHLDPPPQHIHQRLPLQALREVPLRHFPLSLSLSLSLITLLRLFGRSANHVLRLLDLARLRVRLPERPRGVHARLGVHAGRVLAAGVSGW